MGSPGGRSPRICRRARPPSVTSAAAQHRAVWPDQPTPRLADRERIGREASPSAAVLDSQSIKTTESGGPRDYDAGKRVNGRKRQALADMDGRALVLDPQPADVQDRDGAVPVVRLSRRTFPFITKRSPMQAMLATVRRPPRSSRSKSCVSRPIKSLCRASRPVGR